MLWDCVFDGESEAGFRPYISISPLRPRQSNPSGSHGEAQEVHGAAVAPTDETHSHLLSLIMLFDT